MIRKNPIQRYINDRAQFEHVKKAQDLFKFVPYHIKNSKYLYLAKTAAVLLPAISIITASYYISQQTANFLGGILSIVIASIFVLSIEYLKANFLKDVFRNIYQKATNYLLFVVSILLIILSSYLSLQGIKDIRQHTDSTRQAAAEVAQQNINKIDTRYSKEISEAKNALLKYQSSASWQDPQLLADMTRRISKLEKDRREAIKDTKAQNAKIDKVLDSNQTESIVILLVIVALIEVFIIVAAWFKVHFYAKTKDQKDALNKSYKIETEDLESVIRAFYLNYQDKFQDLAQDLAPESNDLAARMEAARQDITKGITDRRELSKRHKLNINQITEVFASMKKTS